VRRVYTDADYMLFADIPAWYGLQTVSAGQSFLGPVLWEPVVAEPSWLAALPQQRPLIYVTMGSSGNPAILPAIYSALAKLPVIGVVSTAGSPVPGDLPANVYAASYLSGNTIIQKADLVICNGGSPTTQQALNAGVPVIGLAGNLDQYLNMGVLESIGAGILMRSGTAGAVQIATAVQSGLRDGQLLAAARNSSQQMQQFDAPAICSGVLRQLAGTSL
jgi:UDP:flavonoid glycosyltransferase YjiC (YdhE family)